MPKVWFFKKSLVIIVSLNIHLASRDNLIQINVEGENV